MIGGGQANTLGSARYYYYPCHRCRISPAMPAEPLDTNLMHAWHYTTARGITLRGVQSPLTGKPIVHFLHGTGFNGMVYWPLLRQLLPHFDLVITNAQGHGGSDTGNTFFGWEANAALIHEALQHRKAQWGHVPVIGMGHSFGGILTTLVANRPPAVFERLLLLDPIFLPPSHIVLSSLLRATGLIKKAPMVKLARQRRAHWPDRDAARQSLYQRGVFRGWDDEAFNAYIDHALDERDDGVHLLTPTWLEAQVFSGYANSIWRNIRQLRLPCHVIIGDKTFAHVRNGLQRALRLNPHITQAIVPGGHCFMQEQPAVAAAAVLSALRDNISATEAT